MNAISGSEDKSLTKFTKPYTQPIIRPEEDPMQFFSRLGYTFGRTLGEGSYCKVRLASKGDQTLAVKIITREQQSKDFVRRFLPREMEILQKVKHPNIIKVYNIIDLKSQVYIFMEAIERGDLLEYIREKSRLSEREAFRYFSQLISAIQYLHSMNICHRDLKCENIMLTENDVIKIIDFGFCRSCVDDQGRRTLSETYCGSTAYASPEVLMGRPYNPMMYDIWSLGCVLFIMVSGTMPYDDTNVRMMIRDQMRKKIRFPSAHIVSHEVKHLVKHILEPDVTKRATIEQITKSRWFSILSERNGQSSSSRVSRQ